MEPGRAAPRPSSAAGAAAWAAERRPPLRDGLAGRGPARRGGGPGGAAAEDAGRGQWAEGEAERAAPPRPSSAAWGAVGAGQPAGQAASAQARAGLQFQVSRLVFCVSWGFFFPYNNVTVTQYPGAEGGARCRAAEAGESGRRWRACALRPAQQALRAARSPGPVGAISDKIKVGVSRHTSEVSRLTLLELSYEALALPVCWMKGGLSQL